MSTPETRRLVLSQAMSWIGTPYRHQGSTRGVGCDCLGLVRGVWRAVYQHEPPSPGPYAPDWAETAGTDRLMDAARKYCVETEKALPGDLLVFRWRPQHTAKHLGILVAEDRFLHAYEGHEVLISPLIPQWRRRIAGVFAFPTIDTTT
jgi:NlpC/P60 family putative phage cell wall peptidase